MKDLEEFARAKAAGCELEICIEDGYEWTELITDSIGFIEHHLKMQCIRIKPNKTYYRVYLFNGENRVWESATPFEDCFLDWVATMVGGDYKNIKDFEIEQPVKPQDETIELFEFEDTEIQNNIIWTRNPNPLRGYRRTDSAPITAVIKGDVS